MGALRQALTTHVKTLETQCTEVAQLHASVAAAKTEIDASLASARDQAQQFKQLIETGAATTAQASEARAIAHAAAQQTADSNSQALAVLESIRASASGAADAAARAEASRTQVEQTAAVVATKSEHIEQGRLHTDEVRAKLDTSVTQAQQSATSAEAHHQTARTTAESVSALLVSAQGVKANIDAIGESIAAVRGHCDAHMAATKRLADTAEAVEAGIASYESKLAEFAQSAADRLKTIDALLLGATNAGLASAFDKRSKTFKLPEKIWQSVFVGSLVVLLALAVVEAVSHGGRIPEYSELGRMLLLRLPFLGPLVWLAIFSARQASLAKRMEEEYAFKATISTSFEGYRRELAAISNGLPESAPLARLCNDTLRTIGAPPGQIYENHRMDPTPATAAAEIVAPIVDGVSKALADRLPKT